MTIEKTNPITAHELTLMPPTSQQLKPFGWIRLLNGSADAGYVYLESDLAPADPHLGGGGTYIVTAMPFDLFEALLVTLRSEQNLQIRYFDPQTAGVSPSVFIEAASPTQLGFPGPFRVPDEVAADLRRLLPHKR